MDYSATMLRNEIANDLYTISRELDEIAQEVRKFQGIGTENCASQLINISQKYQEIRSSLYRI